MKYALLILFLVNSVFTNAQNDKQIDNDSFEVYNWYNSQLGRYELVSASEKNDIALEATGWRKISFAFTGFKNPSNNRVMLNSWVRNKDNDYLIIEEDKYTDEQMKKMGYTDKKELFYIRKKNAN